ncbi:MAG: hypothetical protein AAGA56_00695 [Myxococcota bacterium]
MIVWKHVMLTFLAVPAFVAVGCADGDDEQQDAGPQIAKSTRGESCRARNDCADDLRCVNNICSQDDFAVATTAKNCDLIECTAPADCCNPPANCAQLEQQCNIDGPGSLACQQFEAQCECNFRCEADRCIPTCVDDFDCPAGTCVNGTCAGCMDANDCGIGQSCVGGQCVTGCTGTQDCPYFSTCTDGQCVEVGCQTDRECAASTENGLATCVDGECSAPCTSDAECNPGGYRFQACVDSQCVYVGCDSNEECRIFLQVPVGSPQQVICR